MNAINTVSWTSKKKTKGFIEFYKSVATIIWYNKKKHKFLIHCKISAKAKRFRLLKHIIKSKR